MLGQKLSMFAQAIAGALDLHHDGMHAVIGVCSFDRSADLAGHVGCYRVQALRAIQGNGGDAALDREGRIGRLLDRCPACHGNARPGLLGRYPVFTHHFLPLLQIRLDQRLELGPAGWLGNHPLGVPALLHLRVAHRLCDRGM